MRNGAVGGDTANIVPRVVVPALHRAVTILKRAGIDTAVHADSTRREARLEFVTRHGARRPAAGGRSTHLSVSQRGGTVFVKGYGPSGMANDGGIAAAQVSESRVLQRALAFAWQIDGASISADPCDAAAASFARSRASDLHA